VKAKGNKTQEEESEEEQKDECENKDLKASWQILALAQ